MYDAFANGAAGLRCEVLVADQTIPGRSSQDSTHPDDGNILEEDHVDK